MTPRIARVLNLARQNLFILFNFVFLGPPLGWAAILPFWTLFATVEKAMGKPVSVLEWAVTPLALLFGLPLGIPYAYWIGFAPALIAGGVVCVVHTAGLRISWPAQIAAATAAFLSEVPRGTSHLTPENILMVAIPCLVATVACCWLLRRWTEFSGLEP